MTRKSIIKRILSAVMATAIVVSMTPLVGKSYSAQAKTKKISSSKKAPAATKGNCGENLTYSFDSSTGTLKISGTGEMYHYDSKANKSPFSSDPLKSSITKVIIADGITSVGDFAFEGCSALTAVELPNSLKVIGGAAFGKCSSLVDIAIPNNLETIDGEAFSGCSALKSITIPASVKRIEPGTFQSCEALETVNLSDGLKEIGYYAFSDCPKLNNIHIPESVSLIEEEAFSFCSALSGVSLPHNISYIDTGTFMDCGFKSVTIPSNVSRIGYQAFYENTSLESVVIEDGTTEICRSAFEGCVSLKSITIPASVKTIDSFAFKEDTNVIIHGYTGSYAQTYAKEEGYKFVALEDASRTNVYSITYDLDGGRDRGSYVKNNYSFYTEKTASFSLVSPKKDGYEFVGWTGSNGSTPQKTVTIQQGSTGDKSYKANWIERQSPYVITYILNGGTATGNPTSYTDTTDTFSLNAPTREGYTFIGWSGSNGDIPQLSVSVEKFKAEKDLTYIANWSKNDELTPSPRTYTITYDLEGGTVTGNPATYTNETDTFTLHNPTKNGYIFTGWTWDVQTIPQTTVTIEKGSTGNKEYTANWQKNPDPTPIEYTITYNLADGTATGNNPTSYTSETATFTLSNPTRDGYTFTGWTWDGHTMPQITVTISQGSTGNKAYTANWQKNPDPTPTEYTITYNLAGGTATGNNPTSYTAETATFTLSNPTRDGYTFTGWTWNVQTTPQSTVTITRGSTGNKAYTANWQRNPKPAPTEYTITYNLAGGTATGNNPTSYTSETATFTLSNPTRDGYTFTGWTWSGQTTPQTTVTIPQGSTGNKTYTANWQRNPKPAPTEYTITYNLAGGTATGNNPTSYTSETATFTLSNPTRDGYTFTGWTWSGQTTPQTTVTIPQGSTGNKAYTANWTRNDEPTPTPSVYTITYNLDGGTVSGNPESYTEDTDTFTLNNPTKQGYTFRGWVGSNGVTPVTSVIVRKGTAGNLSYIAIWEKNDSPSLTYSITYNLDGGVASGNPTSYTALSEDFTLNNPTRDGYTFTGWTGSNGDTQQTSVTIPRGSTGNLSYTAHWEKDATPSVRYTITYDLAGGTVSGNPELYTEDDTIKLNNPTREGYTFTGWTGSNGSTRQTTVVIPKGTTGNLSYTANWRRTPKSYTITYNLNGGSATGNPTSYTDETDTFTLNNPTRNGYTFTGWTGSNGNTPQTSVSIQKGTSENLTYTANWQLKEGTYQITYTLNGGTVTGNPEIYTSSTETFTLVNPTRGGYIFTGWTGTNITTPRTTVTIQKGTTGDLTYYANWQANLVNYTITYDLNGGSDNGTNITSYNADTNTFYLNNPYRSGYIFTGWTGSNGTIPQMYVTVARGTTGNLTFTANWSLASSGDSNGSNSGTDDSEDNLTGDDVTDEDEQELIDSIQTKKGKVTKLTAGKKKITLKFNKVTLNGATVKYQVAIKQNDANKWKKSYVSGAKKTFKKLKGGKTYWISVRPYIEVDGEKYFGKWAETKVKTTKK